MLGAKEALAQGADIDASLIYEEGGYNALRLSVNNHNLEICKFLLETNANPNIMSYNIWSPLHAVINQKNCLSLLFTKLLLVYGADFKQVNDKGASPEQFAINCQRQDIIEIFNNQEYLEKSDVLLEVDKFLRSQTVDPRIKLDTIKEEERESLATCQA